MPIKINSQFDSGNIKLLGIDDSGVVRLEIEKDRSSDFLQWFHFSLTGAKGKTCQISIETQEQLATPKAGKTITLPAHLIVRIGFGHRLTTMENPSHGQ